MTSIRRHLASACVLSLLGPAALASDVVFHEDEMLLAPNPHAFDVFGSCVEIDGDTLAVGAPGRGTGAVYVFQQDGGSWSLKAVLSVPTFQVDTFGDALALEGDRMAVGASTVDAGALDSGEVYVFERSGGVWTQSAQLRPGVPVEEGLFGAALALEGDLLAVGSRDGDMGLVHVLEHAGGSWSEVQVLTSSQGGANDSFGSALDLDAGTLVVGAPDARGDDGLVHVYTHGPGGFTLEAVLEGVLPPSGFPPPRTLGYDVAIQGDTLVAGAPKTTTTGGAWIFERSGGVWSQSAVLCSSIRGTGRAGHAVAIDGDLIALGAPWYPYPRGGLPRGGATLWERQPGGWVERALFVPLDGRTASEVGDAIALQGDLVAAGDGRNSLADFWAGALLLFEVPATTGHSFCFGDGHPVDCPCGWNNRTPDAAGCRNSTLRGAVLLGFGSGSVAADDLELVACELIPSQPALLFHGTTEPGGGDGLPFGDGLRCVGGATSRVSIQDVGPDGGASWSALASGEGFVPGDLARFQVWYRDPSGHCAQGFNTTNGMRVAFGL